MRKRKTKEEDRLIRVLQSLGVYESSDIECLRDDIERQIIQSEINRIIDANPEIAESYTNKDRGIKSSVEVDQWYDGGTNQEDINKAILRVGTNANKETHKESKAKKVIKAFISEGYFGYLKLRKLIGKPLEHPVLRPWYAGELVRIPSLVNPGGKVTLLEGTYTLSGKIQAKSNLVLEGNGWQNTRLLMATSSYAIDLSNYDNITIRELEIDGNNRAYGPERVISGNGCNDITVERIFMHDHGSEYGVEIWNGDRIRVQDSKFTRIGQSGDSDPVSIQQCNYVWVVGNTVYDSVYEYRAGAIEVQDGGGIVIVADNEIHKSQVGIVVSSHGYDTTSPIKRAVVGFNHVEVYNVDEHSGKYQAGIWMGGNGNYGAGGARAIVGNVIKVNCMAGDHGINSWNTGIRVYNHVEDVTIIGNIVDCAAFQQERGNACISIHYVNDIDKRIIVSSNILLNAYQAGILIENGNEQEIVISNNICYGCEKGIHIKDGDYIFIEGNNLRGNTTAITVESGKNTHGWIRNNPGYNPVGVSSITVGTSPFTYTAGSSPETVYIRGGTVSDISVDGTTLFTDTGHSIDLEPHQSVVITYSSTPTMVKYIH